MRMGYWILGLTVTASAVAMACAAAGCGGSEETPAGVTDAGNDATTADATRDVAVQPPVDSAPPCPDADLLTYNPPDADINEAGATVGTCLGCIRDPAKCRQFVAKCNEDCSCKESVIDFAECVGQGKALFGCALGSGFQSSQLGRDLGTCVLTGCGTPCGVPADAGFDVDAGGG